MLRQFMMIVVVLGLSARAFGQLPMPPELARLPEAIRTLPWKSIDLASVQTLEYSRALLILNHVLDELAPLRTSEADLMSTYIDQQNLGAELAAGGAPPVAPLTYTDGVKIAVALLRGPLANSSYSSQLANSPESTLGAYRQMYDRTCQRRWAEVEEASVHIRYMAGFLQKKGRLEDYQGWAKSESETRQRQHEQEMAQRRTQNQAQQAQAEAARQAQAEQARQIQLQRENEQLQQALAAAQAQQQAQAAAMQQQQEQAQAQQQAQVVPTAADAEYYGYGWVAPAYYGTGANWYRDTRYEGAARAATGARIAGWHGAGGGARR